MGIDLIRGGRIANRGFRTTKSSNNYLKSLIKVHQLLFSSTHSLREELILSSIKLFIKDLTSHALIVILFLFHASLDFSAKTELYYLKEQINLIVLQQLLELSLTMLDYLIFQKVLELLLFALLKLPEIELLQLKEVA